MKKRLWAVVLAVCMIITMVPITVLAAENVTPDTAWWDNRAEGQTEFTIYTADELAGLIKLTNSNNKSANAETVLGKITVNLGADIDMSAYSGSYTQTENGTYSFTASENYGKTNGGIIHYSNFTLDGQNHKISNYIFSTSAGRCSFIRGTSATGIIENLTFENCAAISASNSKFNAIVVGQSRGSVENVTVQNCIVYGTSDYSAPIAARNSGSIQNCTVENTTVVGHSYMGAVTGISNADADSPVVLAKNNRATNVSLSGSHYVGTISGPLTTVANSTVTFEDNYFSGTISGTGKGTGLLVGIMDNATQSGKITFQNNTVLVSSSKNFETLLGTENITGSIYENNTVICTDSNDVQIKDCGNGIFALVCDKVGATFPAEIASEKLTNCTYQRNSRNDAIVTAGNDENSNHVAHIGLVPAEYNITYVLSNGVVGESAPTTHTYGTTTSLVDPSRTDFAFGGWYDNAEFNGEALTQLTDNNCTDDITLYAKWNKEISETTYTVLPIAENLTYTGKAVAPIVKVKNQSGDIVSADEYTVSSVDVNAGPATAVVKVGDTVIGTAAFEIIRATPTISITADKTNLTGSGTITLTVAGAPAEGAVSVTCDADGINVIDNENGTFSAVLPNETETYTFTATYVAATNGNYSDADPAACIVSVTRRSSFPASSGSSTGSSVTVSSVKNGDVTVSPKTAKKGDTVTITVTPDKGYTLETLTVLDKNGSELTLTDKGSGQYTFTMPDGKVEVRATFMDDNTMLNHFVDVQADDYYYDAVLWAVKNGITKGVSDTDFGPDLACTRAQIVTFLWRAAGSPEPKSVSSFADVSADSYYAKAVAWAVENGITGGTGDGRFSPDATCTREQAVAFLYRASGSPAVSGGSAFSDVAADAYYANAVAWAEKNGVTGGIGGGLFGSGNDCTRAQIVTFLYRAYQGK